MESIVAATISLLRWTAKPVPKSIFRDSDGDKLDGDPRLMLVAESDKGPIIAFFKGDEVLWRMPP